MDRSKFHFKIQIKVRTFDIDAYGIVHNSVYFKYFETARIEYIRDVLKIDPDKFFSNYYFVIARNVCNYISPARFDDILNVYARASYIGNSSFEMEYYIEDAETERPIADGETVIVLLDRETFEPEPIPDDLREKILEAEGDNVIIRENKRFA
jgi:acyl-CoA thioester hydrolase